MTIRIVAVGKKHEPWVAEGIKRYQTRLKRPFEVEWVLLPHSSREGELARQDESRRILEQVTRNSFTILLDERGELYSSPAVSRLLMTALESARQVVLVIGGAYGVDESVRMRASALWSLSPLVFPHQLVRLILIEQLYRAQEIAAGHPYHHK